MSRSTNSQIQTAKRQPDHRRRGPIKGRSDLGGHRNRVAWSRPGPAHHLRGPRIGVRGKRLRAAFQYVAKGEPSPEEVDLWEKSGWTGCKLWGSCGGTRCKDGDPDEKGRLRFRTPVLIPRDRPQGCHPVDRRLSACPLKECDPWVWSAVHTWNSWTTFGGSPVPGALSQQPARLLDALAIIDAESALVRAYHSEVQARRSKMRKG
jgi:hypothetical protein